MGLCVFFLDLSRAQRSFAQVLNDFRFECIGEVETDDEIHIGKLNYVYSPSTLIALEQFTLYSQVRGNVGQLTAKVKIISAKA